MKKKKRRKKRHKMKRLNPDSSPRNILRSVSNIVEDERNFIIVHKKLNEDQTFNELKLCVIPVFLEGNRNKQIFDLLVDTGAETTLLRNEIVNLNR